MKHAVLSLLALTLAACATVQHGPVQRISVESDPPDAVVKTDHCGPGSTRETRTPGAVWVSRRAERCTITVTADGYVGKRIALSRVIAPEFLENLDALQVCGPECDEPAFFFLGGFFAGAGIGVDAISGALFELQPDAVSVTLEPHEDL
ncbi:MAG TPA: hypothetical protein VGD79_04890 [Thermoanaerobaculia bacterium]